jgi:hypothetical protein
LPGMRIQHLQRLRVVRLGPEHLFTDIFRLQQAPGPVMFYGELEALRGGRTLVGTHCRNILLFQATLLVFLAAAARAGVVASDFIHDDQIHPAKLMAVASLRFYYRFSNSARNLALSG